MAHSTAFMPSVGESLPAISIPITLQRLVMEAGANRDFSLMHHDGAVARQRAPVTPLPIRFS
jgi:hypothetical protein